MSDVELAEKTVKLSVIGEEHLKMGQGNKSRPMPVSVCRASECPQTDRTLVILP